MLRSVFLAIAVLAVAACSSEPSSSPTDAGADTSCAPLPCPSNAPWSHAECRCVAADAGTPAIHASDYSQTCNTADDCVAIAEGPLCGCGCPNAGINKSDRAREEADAQREHAKCPPGGPSCGVCSDYHVRCVSGRCAVESCNANPCPPEDAGADAAPDGATDAPHD